MVNVFDYLDDARKKLREVIDDILAAADEFEVVAARFEDRGVEKAARYYKMKANLLRALVRENLEPVLEHLW